MKEIKYRKSQILKVNPSHLVEDKRVAHPPKVKKEEEKFDLALGQTVPIKGNPPSIVEVKM